MVLTEDSSKGAYPTVHALTKEMLKQLVPNVQTDRIEFTPLEDESARLAMHANRWDSTDQLYETHRRRLASSIANELLKPNSFVLYHIDGDCRWSERQNSEKVKKFHGNMMPRISEALAHGLQRKNRSENERIVLLNRIRLLVPFYSVEAWTYQNTNEAKRLCGEEGCGRCDEKLAKWEQQRALIDEELQPKKSLCIGNKHNKTLATSHFPTKEAYDANTSLAQAIMDLLECGDLTSILEKTYIF